MKEVRAYKSVDGRLFLDAEECKLHEIAVGKIFAAAGMIKEYCRDSTDCNKCPFSENNVCIFCMDKCPEGWDIPSIESIYDKEKDE